MNESPATKPIKTRKPSLAGTTFGYLVAMHIDPESTSKARKWVCKCTKCGSIKAIREMSLLGGDTKSCGCAKGELCRTRKAETSNERASISKPLKSKIPSLEGKSFGYLVALYIDTTSKTKSRKWVCKCTNCDSVKSVHQTSLLNGTTKSCGCAKAQMISNKRTLDVISKTYNNLTVISRLPGARVIAKCICGNEKSYLLSNITRGVTKSCGCQRSEEYLKTIQANGHSLDLMGKVFTYLTPVSRAPAQGGNSRWNLLCKCGNTHVATTQNLMGGSVKSCGCLLIERLRKYTITDADGEPRGLHEYANEIGVPYTTLQQILKAGQGKQLVLDYIKEYKTNKTKVELAAARLFEANHHGKGEVGGYKPDFSLGNSLFINVDGLYWHSEAIVGSKYHFDMRSTFEKNSQRMMQFYEDEIFDKPEIVSSIIKNARGMTEKKVFARKTKCLSLESRDASLFFQFNHLMGDFGATAKYFLEFNGEIVAGIAVKVKQGVLDISRFCNANNTTVIGGFDKLLKRAQADLASKGYKFSKVHCWIDLRYGTGKHMTQIGFTQIKEVQGFCWTNLLKRFNRLTCRANMDERGLSEAEHAKEMNLVKIFDAGQRLFEKGV